MTRYSIGIQSQRERYVRLEVSDGGWAPSSGSFSLTDMALVLGATIGGTVGSWVLLGLLAEGFR